MNNDLTIALLRDEIKTIMKRVAKADRRLAKVPADAEKLVGGGAYEPEAARRERLLKRVSEIEAQIKQLQVGEQLTLGEVTTDAAEPATPVAEPIPASV